MISRYCRFIMPVGTLCPEEQGYVLCPQLAHMKLNMLPDRVWILSWHVTGQVKFFTPFSPCLQVVSLVSLIDGRDWLQAGVEEVFRPCT